jgi:putative phosphoribosyl transferase
VRFADRAEAGELLARALSEFEGGDAVILGVPRGGVVVAAAAARSLHLELDVVVPRKVGAPGNPELGLGAVAPGVVVLDDHLIERLRVREDYLEDEIEAQMREIERRQHAYRGGRPPAQIEGRPAIIVDDGVATGGTAIAALRWAGAQDPSEVVFAAPVAPPSTVERLRVESDDVVVLVAEEPFVAVGEWYRSFEQTTDEQVVAALSEAAGSAP